MKSEHDKIYEQDNPGELLQDIFAEQKGENGLRCKVVAVRNSEGKLWIIKFYEQNIRTRSQYAVRAKKGEKIAWGFQKGQYFCRVSETEGFVMLNK